MAISVKKRTNYNPASGVVSQKYEPLEFQNKTISNSADIQSIANDLMLKRLHLLERLGGGIARVNYYSKKGEDAIVSDEKETPAPVAVLSSGRSKYIKQYLSVQFKTAPTSVLDKNAFVNTKGKPQGSLWYDPRRVNAGADPDPDKNEVRNIYIFVHRTEYNQYCKDLKGISGITIVGWLAGDAIGSYRTYASTMGFGMSRHVILRFFEQIFNNSECKKDAKKVWLVDDDVAYVNRFPGFTTIEGFGLAATGVKGCTDKWPTENVMDIFSNKYVDKPETLKVEDFAASNGIIQQVSLWNLKELKSTDFSPIFISAKEDSSYQHYLDKAKKVNVGMTTKLTAQKLIFEGGPIPKGVGSLRNIRSEILKLSQLHLEGFQVEGEGVRGDTTLLKYVTPIASAVGEPLIVTYSKAVEQIMELLITSSPSSVPTGVFDLNPSDITNRFFLTT